ncbi:MAG: tol-pal system protein YbgF [Gammaproteobacteria bacterium]
MYYLIVLFSLLLAAPVFAEETQPAAEVDAQMSGYEPITQDISGRLDRLEKYLNNSALLDMLDVLEQLKLEVNELRGQVEIQTYNIEQLQQKQRDLYTDVDSRLQRMEKNGYNNDTASLPSESGVDKPVEQQPGNSAAETPPTVAVNNKVPSSQDAVDSVKAQADYQRAFRLLKESNYEQALIAFKQYLTDHPGSSYSDNAQYWLGETNFVMQKYDSAINEYQVLLNSYPDSQKASQAMLKIGYSYAELGNNSDAEKTLNEVKSQYPGTTAARLATDRLRKILSQKDSNT